MCTWIHIWWLTEFDYVWWYREIPFILLWTTICKKLPTTWEININDKEFLFAYDFFSSIWRVSSFLSTNYITDVSNELILVTGTIYKENRVFFEWNNSWINERWKSFRVIFIIKLTNFIWKWKLKWTINTKHYLTM